MFPFDSRITLVGNPRFIIPKGEHKLAGDRLMRRLRYAECYCEECGVGNFADRGNEVSFAVLILQNKRDLTNALRVECEYSRSSRKLWAHSELGEKIGNAVVAWVVYDYLQVKPENAADCVDALAEVDARNERLSVGGYSMTMEKPFKTVKDINYVQYLAGTYQACLDADEKFGADVTKWPIAFLPFAAAKELILIVEASEVLKERLAGNEIKKEGLQPLHVLLDPDQGPLFPILKKIFCAFPSLPDGEYVEGLYEQLFAVGLFSEFYLSLSTTDEGVRLLPTYKSFWTGTFTDLFCSQTTKKKQRVTEAQAKAAYRELAECCRKLASEAEIQNSHVLRRMFREGRLPPGNVRPERMQKDSFPEEVAARVLRELQQNTIPVVVDGYTPRGCQAAVQIVNTKRPERDYFSDGNLAVLFGDVHHNTIANWRKRKGAPEGFSAAFEQKNYKAMKVCAEKYKVNRGKHDAMNSRKVRRNLSAEQVYKESKGA